MKDYLIRDIAGLIKRIKNIKKIGNVLWFRGQGNSDWPLVPSIGRGKKTPSTEFMLIKRFRQNAIPHLTHRPENAWEWLFLMQHHRLPTRLLDWTEDPLVALYFAVTEQTRKDGALWCLDPVALNLNAKIRYKNRFEIPAFGSDNVLDNYLPERIKAEAKTELQPAAGIAVRTYERISAQQGVFTITHRIHCPIEDVGDSSHVTRLIIPFDMKGLFRTHLQLLGIHELSIFPDLDRVAKHAREAVK